MALGALVAEPQDLKVASCTLTISSRGGCFRHLHSILRTSKSFVICVTMAKATGIKRIGDESRSYNRDQWKARWFQLVLGVLPKKGRQVGCNESLGGD